MLNRLFFSLKVRERLLLTLFIWVLLTLWFFGTLDDWQSVDQSLKNVKNGLAEANRYLSTADQTRADLAAAKSGVEPGRTLSAAELVGLLDGLARESNLDFEIRTPTTEQSDPFSFHTVRVAIRRAKIEALEAFDRKLKEHAPYMSLRHFQITASRRDPALLDATLEVESFELKDAALALAP